MKKSFKKIVGIVLSFTLIFGVVFSNKIDLYASDTPDLSYTEIYEKMLSSYSILQTYDFNCLVHLCRWDRHDGLTFRDSYIFLSSEKPMYTAYYNPLNSPRFSSSFGVSEFLDGTSSSFDYYIFSPSYPLCDEMPRFNYVQITINDDNTFTFNTQDVDNVFFNSFIQYFSGEIVLSNYNVRHAIFETDSSTNETVCKGTDGALFKQNYGLKEDSSDTDIPIENPDNTITGNIFTWIKSILANIIALPLKISVALQGFFDELPSNIVVAFSSILSKITTKVESLKLGIDDLPLLIATNLSSFFANLVIKVTEVKDKVGDIFDNIKSLPETLFTKFTRLFIPDEDFMHSKILQLTDHLTKFGIKTYDITSLFAKEQAITSFEGTYRGKEVTFIDMRYLDLFLNKFRPVIRGFIVLCLMLFNVNQFLNLIGQGSISVSGVLNAVKERDKGDKE